MSRLDPLLVLLDTAYNQASWHGPNLRSSLRGVSLDAASCPLEGSNFFERPVKRTSAAWRADLRLLDAVHRDLRAAVAATTPRELNARLPGSKVTRLRLITGAAAHDVYHAGQIQLLKKLHSRRHAGR
jgi:DinB family protein